jgi:hypothetical protein
LNMIRFVYFTQRPKPRKYTLRVVKKFDYS